MNDNGKGANDFAWGVMMGYSPTFARSGALRMGHPVVCGGLGEQATATATDPCGMTSKRASKYIDNGNRNSKDKRLEA